MFVSSSLSLYSQNTDFLLSLLKLVNYRVNLIPSISDWLFNLIDSPSPVLL